MSTSSESPLVITQDDRPLNVRFPDCMVDLESTGLNFERNAILQIAAVRFNLVERTIDHNFFNQTLAIPANRFWDEGTREWWLKKREVLNQILGSGRPARQVMIEFLAWAGHEMTMWAKPTHFDHTFLKSYCEDHDLVHPFHYRKATDVNSFLRARYFPTPAPNWERDLPFDGPVHNAIFDCLHQIKVLFKAVDDTTVDSKFLQENLETAKHIQPTA